MKNCTFLVTSCDKYEDAWQPFFFFLKKYWPDFDMPIILNTETKQFCYEDLKIKTFSFYKEGEKVAWSQRLLDHLDRVETDYILLMCEDYFLRKPVREERLAQVVQAMEEDPEISTFEMMSSSSEGTESSEYPDFLLQPQRSDYRFHVSGLWRVSHLKMYLKPDESPWEFEMVGNYRSYFTKNKFYSLKPGIEPYLDFKLLTDGVNLMNWGIVRGKWILSDVQPLFEENGLKVDFNRLGTMEIEPKYKKKKRTPKFLKFLSSVVRYFSKKKRIQRQKIKEAYLYVEECKKRKKWN